MQLLGKGEAKRIAIMRGRLQKKEKRRRGRKRRENGKSERKGDDEGEDFTRQNRRKCWRRLILQHDPTEPMAKENMDEDIKKKEVKK